MTLTTTAEIAEVRLCGGAGYGDPKARDLGAVAADLADGYVTPEGATRDYGAVLREDGSLDEKASQGAVAMG